MRTDPAPVSREVRRVGIEIASVAPLRLGARSPFAARQDEGEFSCATMTGATVP